MQNKPVRFGPTSLANGAVTCVANPGTITPGVGPAGTNTKTYFIIRHMRIVNTSASPITVKSFIGANATDQTAGLEFAWSATSDAASSYLEWYGYLRLDAADFLNFLAASSGLTFNGEGEIGVAG